MNLHRIIRPLLAVALILVSVNVQAQSKKGVSILGDSYSTFKGHVSPEKNRVWYYPVSNPEKTDVDKVSQTWWHQLINRMGYRLVQNNSYSGATICNSGYSNNDYTDRSFVSRAGNLGSPDLIYVFGGTNDDWAKSPMGEFKYSEWTTADLYQVRPAIAYLLQSLKDNYPGTDIVVIINSDMRPDVAEALVTISDHYGVDHIQLHDIDKKAGHPTVKGMTQIADQITNFHKYKN